MYPVNWSTSSAVLPTSSRCDLLGQVPSLWGQVGVGVVDIATQVLGNEVDRGRGGIAGRRREEDEGQLLGHVVLIVVEGGSRLAGWGRRGELDQVISFGVAVARIVRTRTGVEEGLAGGLEVRGIDPAGTPVESGPGTLGLF